jgi:D-beta-D-heptose 7-phosphate kinase/D-beta-D-heptose 1-phosphate adenosyltransferase
MIKNKVPDFSKTRVLIVGDVMLDRYWHGNATRISPEAPVPVVQVKGNDECPGGAGNVALNTAALGARTILLGAVGDDAEADILARSLQTAGVDARLQKIAKAQTIAKLRVLSLHQQLIRLDFEDGFYALNTAQLLSEFKTALLEVDVVILSDYAKGTLQCAPQLIELARNANVPVLVDPKGSNVEPYRGASLLTPNRKEFEAIVGVCQNDEEIIAKGLKLIRDYEIAALLVTRGEQGMTLIRENEDALHLTACSREVYDVTGAGDTVIAFLAASLAAGASLSNAAILANIAAGVVVGKLGAATVSVAELRRALLSETGGCARGVLSEDALLTAIEDAKAHGERVVMTGGCFDILHAGHVSYLEEAKALGDRLIVVVNDDASVSRLKGPKRPINSLAQRMAVLAGLNAVDWVVSFSEDTPERIISHLMPDIWVKAGDYTVEKLPETSVLAAYGGEVKILGFVNGCSTSAVVKQIQEMET